MTPLERNLNLGRTAIHPESGVMDDVMARMFGGMVDRCGRVKNHVTSFALFATMTCWLSLTAWTEAEVLDVLVLEVDARLVEPTLARAFAQDRAGLDEALGKLRKLAPDKGVVEHASVSLDLGEGKERAGKSGMDSGPEIPDRGQQYRKFGWSLIWEPGSQSRELKITPRASASSAPVYTAKLIHPPDGRWSLSAGMTTPKGALFIFEKIDGRNDVPGGRLWVASSLLAGKKSTSRLDPKPERCFSSNTAIRSALLREPPNEDQFGYIETDLKPFCGAWKSFAESKVTFSARMGKMRDAGKIVPMVDFRYVQDIQPSSHTQYAGSFYHPVGKDQVPNHVSNSFDAVTILVARQGTTTTSTPQPKNKAKEHQLQILVFRTN